MANQGRMVNDIEGKGEGPAEQSSFHELLGLLQAEYDRVANSNASLQTEVDCLRASPGLPPTAGHGPPDAGHAVQLLQGGLKVESAEEAPDLGAAGEAVQSPSARTRPTLGDFGESLSFRSDGQQLDVASASEVVGPEVLDCWQVKGQPPRRKNSITGAQWTMQGPKPADINKTTSFQSNLTSTSKLTRAKISTPKVIQTLLGLEAPIRTFCDKLVLPPESHLTMVWDILGMGSLLIDVLHTPLVFFREPDTLAEACLAWLTTIFWTFDIVITFFRGFYKNCIVEMRAKLIAKRYLRREFLADVIICSADWALLVLQEELSSAVNHSRLGKTIRIARIVRLLRFVRLMVKMPRLLHRMTSHLSETAGSIAAVVKTLLLIMITNHLIACLWYGIGSLGSPAWTDTFNEQERGSFYRYATSLHWSITQFTPASMEVQPTNSAERVFAICTIIVGLLMFSSFVSTITSTMSTLRVQTWKRTMQIDNFRRWVRDNHISLPVSSRISVFLNTYRFTIRSTLANKDPELLKALPKNLQLMIDWEIYQPILVRQAFFSRVFDSEPAAMLQICHNAVEEVNIANRGELYSCASRADAMYISMSGEMEYFQGFNEHNALEIDGRTNTIFNAPALWLSWIHQGRVFALTSCIFLRLSAASLTKVLVNYPDLMRAGQQYAQLLSAKILELLLEMVEEDDRPRTPTPWNTAGAACTISSDLFCLEHEDGAELAQRAFEKARSTEELKSQKCQKSRTSLMSVDDSRLSL